MIAVLVAACGLGIATFLGRTAEHRRRLSQTHRNLCLEVSGPVGQYGWDGGLGTSWRVDPAAQMCGFLLTQRAWTSPVPPDVCADFWTSAYQAIGD